MNHTYKHIKPNIEDWPIYMFHKNRDEFIKELNQFVFNRLKQNNHSFQDLLAKTIYLENQRVRVSPWKVDPPDDKNYWHELSQEMNNALKGGSPDHALDQIMMRIINRYNSEIVGGFNAKTFKFARKFLTAIYKRLFNKFNEGKNGRFWGNKATLESRLKVFGSVEETRQLFDKGTVLIVPTHFSNLDSIMVGYVLEVIAGLPAFAYGAGLNLYEMELAAYYMNRLGAYRVDRRKKNPIYLECLTSMASFSLYKGLNNIFFPGGTRSRSGAIEDKLKLGLLGSAIEAQRLFIYDKSPKKIIIVPVVLGYNFVLEAKGMVDQFLRVIGKERYMRNKDTAITFPDRIRFFKSLFTRKSFMYLSFGEPMDVMGNKIGADGQSYDKNGQLINLEDYFRLENDLSEDSQRENVYTKLLGQKIVESFIKNNIVLPSHLISFLLFEVILRYRKDLDMLSIIKLHPSEVQIPKFVFKTMLISALEVLQAWENQDKLKLDDCLKSGDLDEIIARGIDECGIYHGEKVIYESRDQLCTENLKLLYYYHNRLDGYRLDEELDWTKVKEFNFIEKMGNLA